MADPVVTDPNSPNYTGTAAVEPIPPRDDPRRNPNSPDYDPNLPPFPFAASETMTFAEWCAADPAVLAADKAAFDKFYVPVDEAILARREALIDSDAHNVLDGAFARFYGSGHEQKMDRGTLDLRLQAMATSLEASPPPLPEPVEPAPAPAPAPPPTS